MRRLLALLVVVWAPVAFAQGLEVSLVAGYTTEGGIESNAPGIQDLNLADNFTWGASAGWFFSPRFGIEGSWARQQSGLEVGTPDGSARMFDVNLDQLHGSFVWRLGRAESRIRPFVAAGIGASLFGAPDLESETKLSLALGGGVLWMPRPRVGMRLQARYAPSYLDDSESDFCDPFGFCQDWLHQLQLTGAVVVGF